MADTSRKSFLRQRSTWIASMLACFAFILLAVKVYQLSITELLSDLFTLFLGALAVMAFSAAIGWLLASLRRRRK